MEVGDQAVLLRIIVSEHDTWHGKSLHSALVEAARTAGLAGATVLRGVEGYGAHGRVHTARLVDLSPDLPMLVEIVDEEAKISAFLPVADGMVESGLITTERLTVVVLRRSASG